MRMHLLVPSDPFDKSIPDDAYAEEAAALVGLGWGLSVFSLEDFLDGRFLPRPKLAAGSSVLYRGWMIEPLSYGRLNDAITLQGARMTTSAADYVLCHHLPAWYDLCRDLTIPTLVAGEHSDFPTLPAPTGWSKFFVKDFVKSLSSGRGPVAEAAEDIPEVLSQMRFFRGFIEGGVCVRPFIPLMAHSERRYFVVAGTPHSADGPVPPAVMEVADRVVSPFFSVDVAEMTSGGLIVIELGDGQVSDRKEWTAEVFARMMVSHEPALANESPAGQPIKGLARP